ncbi:hypothetical protein HBI56_039940 [Parastagonospora nodorum]|nr:hypothetical protein HBH56_066830 [Parastagonospora nodorum]KAH3932803.1 hypothetical protein HBH54_081260 [Parastagonospora nodorum]KAH3954892.1 hypothetical protein HBH53_013120 [Parastagonospora nodorum]KAH3986341.1 hypothetical protein HBH52_044320 [Parastagonospora nodorum]KAH3988079.1 hypothetical protein HBH51_004730 [Parastagonospora nodorum]
MRAHASIVFLSFKFPFLKTFYELQIRSSLHVIQALSLLALYPIRCCVVTMTPTPVLFARNKGLETDSQHRPLRDPFLCPHQIIVPTLFDPPTSNLDPFLPKRRGEEEA